MKEKIFILLIAAALISLAGCAKRVSLGPGQQYTSCGIEVVFSQSTTSYREGVKPEDSFWVYVDVELTSEDYDFGYLNELGNFIHILSGAEGSFESGGGQRLYLALRESSGKRTVFGVEDFGTCFFAGTRVQAGQALLPALKSDYFSSVSVVFDIPGGKEVTVTLSASPPNGFTLIAD
ncbi:MAG: hypothetical protein ABIA59_03135 [Candidatus Latescibacterota bacterium]